MAITLKSRKANSRDVNYFLTMIKEFESLLSQKYVICDREQLLSLEQTTFTTTHVISVAILPSRTDEVIGCVRIAAKYQMPLYSISRGKNWGNGGKVPTHNNCVLMDLSRMNTIVDFHEQLAYITIEPGVTQGQIVEFLKQKNSELTMSMTGSALDSSVVGNVLERGDSTGSYGERCQYVCGFEVILSTGEVIHTGFKRFANASCGSLDRFGLGPSLDGLFVQSNLGIVTQMTLWLEPKPKHVHHLFLPIDDEKKLEEAISILQQLFLKSIFQNITIWNDYKLFSCMQQYPYNQTQEQTPLPEAARVSLQKKYGIRRWTAFITLLSFYDTQAQAQIDVMRQSLQSLLPDLEIVKDACVDNALGGSRENVRLAYWRKKQKPSSELDLERDKCGLIWCMLLAPFTGKDIVNALLLIEEICAQYNFEPNIAITGTQTRTLKILLALIYDREVSGEDERAMACHDDLMKQMMTKGYLPYRLGVQSMWAMNSEEDDCASLWLRLKNVFDPNHILSPGRYAFNSNP
jgi:4-cresol dehydrogenase (hydroxylating) flavoprotein subunit